MAGRAQASFEVIALLGIMLAVILFFAVFSSDLVSNLGSQKDDNDARDSVLALAQAADYVYAQGEGASELVPVTLPPSTTFGPNSTYIGKPPSAPAGAPSNTINIEVGATDVYATTHATVNGQFPSSQGKYLMNVTSRGGFVSVGTGLVSASPSSIYMLMRRNDSQSTLVTFSVLSNNTIVVANLTPQWGFSSPALSFAPSEFSSNGFSSMQVRLNFTTSPAVAGIYTGQLNVTSWLYSDPGTRQSFQVPLTVEIAGG
jgi:hypothetical protein